MSVSCRKNVNLKRIILAFIGETGGINIKYWKHNFPISVLNISQESVETNKQSRYTNSTCALGTTLSWFGNGSSTQCRRTDKRHAGDSASDTRAALAGVRGGREGVTVRVHDTCIQTGVTDRTAGFWRDWVGALDWTRSFLTGHHFILIGGGDEGARWKERTA